MVETRIAPRHRVMKRAKIEYGGMKARLCTDPRHIGHGVALEILELTGIVPAAFNFSLTEEKIAALPRGLAQGASNIGVAFY